LGIDGILNINKPEGVTSFGVVARLKRLTGEKRVGHAGTLDPIATGVLPVCFGQATRVAEFIADGGKTYRAEIKLGAVTDTFDREGRIVYTGDIDGVSVDRIEQALASFRGTIEQVPPAYSALKKDGKPYYQFARQGSKVDPRPRRVTITDIRLMSYQPPLLTVEVECGKGTYIRSLAHDLGQRLGCGAFLNNLTRLRCGPFSIEEAVTLPEFECACREDVWTELLHPMDTPLLGWKAVILSGETELAVRHGSPLVISADVGPGERYCRAYNADGHLIAILRFVPDKGYWHPFKVFAPPDPVLDF
jgi:tRNA pseudouridine55 synthase